MTSKEQIYATSTMGHKVGFGKRPVIIVVDFQKEYTRQDLGNTGANMIQECKMTSKLTKIAREKNIKVIYTKQTAMPEGIDVGTFNNKCYSLMKMHEGNSGYELDEYLEVEDKDIIITKTGPSVFFGTNLIQMLIKMHIDTVLLCGCTMGGCVYASAIDSMSYGFRTIIVKDAVGDKHKDVYDMFLFNATFKYADASDVNESIEYINSLETMEYDLLIEGFGDDCSK